MSDCPSCRTPIGSVTHGVLCEQADPRATPERHPSHYGGDTPYETIKVLKAWLGPAEYEGFLKGNALKYISRAGKKGPRSGDVADYFAALLSDIRKARTYLDFWESAILETCAGEPTSDSSKPREQPPEPNPGQSAS